jgi:hypothetical protein
MMQIAAAAPEEGAKLCQSASRLWFKMRLMASG